MKTLLIPLTRPFAEDVENKIDTDDNRSPTDQAVLLSDQLAHGSGVFYATGVKADEEGREFYVYDLDQAARSEKFLSNYRRMLTTLAPWKNEPIYARHFHILEQMKAYANPPVNAAQNGMIARIPVNDAGLAFLESIFTRGNEGGANGVMVIRRNAYTQPAGLPLHEATIHFTTLNLQSYRDELGHFYNVVTQEAKEAGVDVDAQGALFGYVTRRFQTDGLNLYRYAAEEQPYTWDALNITSALEGSSQPMPKKYLDEFLKTFQGTDASGQIDFNDGRFTDTIDSMRGNEDTYYQAFGDEGRGTVTASDFDEDNEVHQEVLKHFRENVTTYDFPFSGRGKNYHLAITIDQRHGWADLKVTGASGRTTELFLRPSDQTQNPKDLGWVAAFYRNEDLYLAMGVFRQYLRKNGRQPSAEILSDRFPAMTRAEYENFRECRGLGQSAGECWKALEAGVTNDTEAELSIRNSAGG